MNVFRYMLFCVLISLCVCTRAQGYIIELAATDSTPAMNVYHPITPCPEEGYPVLYLFHGIRGNHASWVEKGKVCSTVDSLIGIQAIVPPIIVMPYCFTRSREDQYNRIFTRYDDLRRGRFEQIFPTMMAYIEENFPIAQDRSQRFIAGLSSGARQALNLVDTARCSVVGLFSPVLHCSEYPLPGEDMPFYWITVGDRDAFRPETKQFARYLEKHHLPYKMGWAEGKHTWDVWETVLPDFLLFVLGIKE